MRARDRLLSVDCMAVLWRCYWEAELAMNGNKALMGSDNSRCTGHKAGIFLEPLLPEKGNKGLP